MATLRAWAERHRWWLIAFVIVLLLAGFNGQWRMSRDATLYATIGQQIAQGNGFTHPSGAEGRANPGLPYLLAWIFHAFGAQVMWPAVTAIMLCSVAIVLLTYRLFILHADRGTAAVITLLVGVCYTFQVHTMDVLTDVPFMLGAMLFLVGYEAVVRGGGRWWLDWPTLGAGIAVMSVFRVVVVVFIAAALIALVWRMVRDPMRWRLLFVLLTILSVALLVRMGDPRNEGAMILAPKELEVLQKLGPDLNVTIRRMWSENVPGLFWDTTSKALLGNKFGIPQMDFAVGVTVFLSGVLLVRRRILWGALVFLFMAQWCFFLPDVRYFLPVLPLMAYAWWLVAVRLSEGMAAPWGGRLAIALLALWIGPNFARTCGVIGQQRCILFYEHYQDGRFDRLAAFGREVDATVPMNARLVGVSSVRGQIGFYARRPAMSAINAYAAGWTSEGLYVIEPMDAAMRELIRRRGWQLGPVVVEVERGKGSEPWRLRAVLP